MPRFLRKSSHSCREQRSSLIGSFQITHVPFAVPELDPVMTRFLVARARMEVGPSPRNVGTDVVRTERIPIPASSTDKRYRLVHMVHAAAGSDGS
jgi:hypothetical protein